MKKSEKQAIILVCLLCVFTGYQPSTVSAQPDQPPIYISFLWHMHQPVYWPYESVIQTQNRGVYSFSLLDVHTSRTGPYTTWPAAAVQKGIDANLPHFGAQVSFSGSLVENLNNLKNAGIGNFSTWNSSFQSARAKLTASGNPRLDMVAFGYHHPLMGLIRYEDIRKQVAAHRELSINTFGGPYSKGIFPPENAFSPTMIPALADEGLEWVLVDNIHFDRASKNYPWNKGGSIVEPNLADQRNADPGDWIQLNGLWAPTKNSARWGRQPHWVSYTDPSTGMISKLIAVPTDRYLGNEDGRGGFGALNYETVMSQLESANSDPNHPILIVLHHDGDNHGGGTDSYYGSNFQAFVNWIKDNPDRFVCTTVQDYLDLYPPDPTDIIHIEPGSWAGADAGDPEFKKWLGDPSEGYSPDWNSWSSVTWAQNVVSMATDQNPSSADVEKAWSYLMNSQASDYWYWDGTEMWDSHPTRGANLAILQVSSLIDRQADQTPPTIFLPQREPYNPGAFEWEQPTGKTMTVTTLVADFGGLLSVNLHVRYDLDGVNSNTDSDNELYSGGSGVSVWQSIPMTGTNRIPITDPLPLGQAPYFTASVTGYENQLLDYFVEATDSSGNTARSVIQHVWIGNGQSLPPDPTKGPVSWTPEAPSIHDTITIRVKPTNLTAKLHWGVNQSGSNWQQPDVSYWPSGTSVFGSGPAVQSDFSGPVDSTLTIRVGPFNNPDARVDRLAFVIHYADNTWDNHGGKDYSIPISGNPAVTDSLVVHFFKPANWNTAWCYFWNAGNTSGPGWPGTPMSAEGDGWYRFVIPSTQQSNLIFSDNGSKQTPDLFRQAEGWYFNSTWYNSKPTAVKMEELSIPTRFVVGNPFPNPFNPLTQVPVQVPTAGVYRFSVTDLLGRQLKELRQVQLNVGRSVVEIRADGLASGLYLLQVSGPSGNATTRLILTR